MRTSESITNLVGALLSIQDKIQHPPRKSKNPHLRNEFADLPTVIDTNRKLLASAGLVIIQTAGGDTFSQNGQAEVSVTTRLAHSSGEWVEDTVSIPLVERKGMNIEQVAGCAFTYLRRYGQSAILNVASEPDDDGNEEAAPAKTRTVSRRQPAPDGSPPPNMDSRRKLFFAEITRRIDNDDDRRAWCQKFSGLESTKDWDAAMFEAAIDAIRKE